jgi:hypothetical protein
LGEATISPGKSRQQEFTSEEQIQMNIGLVIKNRPPAGADDIDGFATAAFHHKEENRTMKSSIVWPLGVVCAVGLMSGCGGNDNVPIITPNGPTASADDLRTPESDALTSEESTLMSQADSEPDPAPKADL